MDGNVPDVTAAYVESVLNISSRWTPTTSQPTSAPSSNGQRKDGETAAAMRSASDAPATPKVRAAVHFGDYGDDCAVLIRAAVVNDRSDPLVVPSTTEKIWIQFDYRLLRDGFYAPAIGLHFNDTLVFRAVPGDTNLENYRLSPGLYRTSVAIPPHLLNVGTYSVSLCVFNPFISPAHPSL